MEKNNKVRIARFGIASKGLVYSILAVLTIVAAFSQSGQVSSSKDALKFVQNQPFGQVLLIVLIIGLASYVFWRIYQAIADPEDKGNDAKGIFNRLGYALSGIGYGLLTYSAIQLMMDSGSSKGSSKKNMVETLLEQPMGRWLVGIVALFILGKAIYQLYRAYSGKFKDKIKESGLGYKAREIMLKSGKIGYTARGIVIAIISYFFFKAALSANSSSVGGTEKAFEFMQTQSDWGFILMALVAFGLLLYGIFMFIKAKYREMEAVAMQ